MRPVADIRQRGIFSPDNYCFSPLQVVSSP